MQHLRALGYRAQVVEQTIPHTFIKRDCFGVDILALKPTMPILVIQTTSGSNVAARIEKLHASGFTALWKSVGASLEVWGWAKQGPRGTAKRWTLRRETL
jgi:hypothetical protein